MFEYVKINGNIDYSIQMLCILCAPFKQKSAIEPYLNQFEIHSVIWSLRNRIIENARSKGQVPEILQKFKWIEVNLLRFYIL